jgi:hypothetical protein
MRQGILLSLAASLLYPQVINNTLDARSSLSNFSSTLLHDSVSDDAIERHNPLISIDIDSCEGVCFLGCQVCLYAGSNGGVIDVASGSFPG